MSLNYENVGKNVIYNRSVDNIEDYVKGTIVGCYIGEDEEYYITSIESSGECIKVYDDSLIEIIEGGGSGAVSSVNGKTGAVVLDAEDVGAEPEKFIVTVTESSGTYSADKTVTEIATAYAAGKTPIVMFNGKVFALSLDAGSNTPGFNFTFAEAESNQGHIQTLTVDDSDLWEIYDVYTAPAETVVNVSGATPTVTPAANRIYKCGELTSLTISNPPATGKYSIIFFSGATATTIVGIDNFTVEANKRYKIEVEDGYGKFYDWPYTPTP